MTKTPVIIGTLALSLIFHSASSGKTQKVKVGKPPAAPAVQQGPAVLWLPPEDIATRDLYYGAGGKAHEPAGTFTFEKEETDGSNPKFDVVDQNGVKWTVKLGHEARPETAASRLLWAVGYGANEDYFVPVLHVQKMARLHRGAGLVSPDGTVRDVRLKRHLKGEQKIGLWKWAQNPFTGTRECNGLRVMMALMNNWDLKDNNNSVYQVHGDHPEQRYLVSDLGASFGPTGLNWTQRGSLKAYRDSHWIGGTSHQLVDFKVPALPALNHWIGRNIPVTDTKWIGSVLAHLSPQQIRDAFRASGYSAEEAEGFGRVVEQRIAELEKL